VFVSEPHERGRLPYCFYARASPPASRTWPSSSTLKQASCARIFRDVGSGTIRKRPQLEACLDYLPAGDTLVVWRLDRLGRSLHHLVDVVALLEQRHVAFRSLRESIDTTTANGKLQLHLFAALAEFEQHAARGMSFVMPRVRLCRVGRRRRSFCLP
jgi:DNA invertase Pin-like site-specific DNA recombinase